jgi:hypothetical protein
VRDKGSPIMPVNDFRLADFLRARAALEASGGVRPEPGKGE